MSTTEADATPDRAGNEGRVEEKGRLSQRSSEEPTRENGAESPQHQPSPPNPTFATMRQLSVLVQSLEDFGLVLDRNALSPDGVEQLLMTDEWRCEHCGETREPVCSETGKPHRRRLVCIARDILHLVGSRVGRMYVRPAPLAERVEGRVRVRTQRYIKMNPQLLLLAFYFVALGAQPDRDATTTTDTPTTTTTTSAARGKDHCDEDSLVADTFTIECAGHLLDVLKQIETYGKRLESEMDGRYALALLKSFYTTWRQYLRHTEKEVKHVSEADRRVATEELYNGTHDALLAAARQLASDPANDDLRVFIALLYQRVSRLAYPAQLQQLQEELDRIAAGGGGAAATTGAASTVAVPNTPPIRHSNPPAMLFSDPNTSGSEAGEGHGVARMLGPQLPPAWHVDEQGRSRPNVDDAEQARREKYLRLEFKARKGFEAAMHFTPQKSAEDVLRERVGETLTAAQYDLLAQQLDQAVPNLTLVARLLKQVEYKFFEALPRRLREQLEQQFRDIMDWSVVRRSAQNDAASLSNVVRFVIGKVIEYGAPAREPALREESQTICRDLEQASPSVGRAVAKAFEFLFRAIAQLDADIAQYSLLMVSTHLRMHSLEYIRTFVVECLPPPTQWQSTRQFLQSFVNQDIVRQWADSPAAQSVTALAGNERRVRGALLFGMLDLLRSGHRASDMRWSELPAEAFYFEKYVLFEAANTVQECTLLLLLQATVSSMLTSKGLSHAEIDSVLRLLHKEILQLLASDVRLDRLKHAIVEFLDRKLCGVDDDGVGDDDEDNGRADDTLHGKTAQAQPLASATASAPQPPSRALSEVEEKVVMATIDKMTDTDNAIYVSFERKVINFVAKVVCEEPDPAPLGLVTEAAQKQAELLRRMLAYNWEVYSPFYREIIPLLDIQSEPATA